MRRRTQADGPLAFVTNASSKELMMNSTRFALLSRVPVLILITSTASVAQATPRCETPTFAADRVACSKAKESPESLRRFIQRTQSIHMLYFWDYMSESDVERHHMRPQSLDQQPARGATASSEKVGRITEVSVLDPSF